MEFAVVNYFMGPVATTAMKGYDDEEEPKSRVRRVLVSLEILYLAKS
jgi:hypothetical protein